MIDHPIPATEQAKQPTPLQVHPSPTAIAILDAAVEILEEQGLDAVTMRSTAERAFVGKSTVSHYFESKQGLVLALYRRGLHILGDYLDEPMKYEDLIDTFLDGHSGLASILRSMPCPALSAEEAERLKLLFPNLPGRPEDIVTMLVSTSFAAAEFSNSIDVSNEHFISTLSNFVRQLTGGRDNP